MTLEHWDLLLKKRLRRWKASTITIEHKERGREIQLCLQNIKDGENHKPIDLKELYVDLSIRKMYVLSEICLLSRELGLTRPHNNFFAVPVELLMCALSDDLPLKPAD